MIDYDYDYEHEHEYETTPMPVVLVLQLCGARNRNRKVQHGIITIAACLLTDLQLPCIVHTIATIISAATPETVPSGRFLVQLQLGGGKAGI